MVCCEWKHNIRKYRMNEKLGKKKNTQKILTFRWKEKKKIKTTTESVSQSELVAINLSCQYIWYVYAAGETGAYILISLNSFIPSLLLHLKITKNKIREKTSVYIWAFVSVDDFAVVVVVSSRITTNHSLHTNTRTHLHSYTRIPILSVWRTKKGLKLLAWNPSKFQDKIRPILIETDKKLSVRIIVERAQLSEKDKQWEVRTRLAERQM